MHVNQTGLDHADTQGIAMPDTIVVNFPSGNTVRFGSRAGDKLVEKSAESLDKALGALGDVIARLEAAIGGLAHKPDAVEVELSASLKGDCDLWVVSGEAEAEFKVTLKWG
jgi:hypothetical protein